MTTATSRPRSSSRPPPSAPWSRTLRERTDVQNIDLMNLAGFCRNCLAKWYRAAAEERGQAMSYDEARELIYGMPYDDWRRLHQTEASPEANAQFKHSHG